MVVSTEIVNGTDGNLSLKEGNAGVYRDIGIVQAKKKHTITIDPNATYREYAVVSTPGSGDKVFISSDDCIDNSSITIVMNPETGKHEIKGIRRGAPADSSSSSDPQQQQQSILSRMMKKIWPSKK